MVRVQSDPKMVVIRVIRLGWWRLKGGTWLRGCSDERGHWWSSGLIGIIFSGWNGLIVIKCNKLSRVHLPSYQYSQGFRPFQAISMALCSTFHWFYSTLGWWSIREVLHSAPWFEGIFDISHLVSSFDCVIRWQWNVLHPILCYIGSICMFCIPFCISGAVY